ncbi:hypothetical protein KY290_010295 [Solanum tuberosum]|uniref:Ubiquitin-like protease family profile domain-containing protein n=1 Tax=Solanum tuberosum TaxID=4113 RepID=A0ABQ7VZD5_SOLTU|nr:hypothetical protein KY289_010680 [Solanum tuberosum]KAH0773158.1 hypothetical protein KY290_010295 [Solanum tuberosum]
MTKVPKLDFFNKFKHANFFETEDRLKIGILYFITSFLTGSEASKTTIPKLYFDLVESGQYVNFPWGNEYFRLTLKACSRRLGKNPTSFKFSQFHIALQVWFYECCHPFDNSVAIRVSNVTPRILNWKTSNESIFFDELKNTIFRTHGNQHKFRNIVLTEEELNALDQINLHQSSSQHETENQATSERHDVDFDEKYVELKKEIAEVRMELKELKDNVDKHMTDMKAYVDNSTKLIIEEIRSSRGQPSQATHQQDDARQHVEESEKAPMDQPSNTDDQAQKSNDQTIGVVFNAYIPGSSNSKPPTLDDYPDFTMTQIVALDPILNDNRTPDVQPRNRNPGKYDTSPYIRLSEGESSSRRVPILFRIKHPFESHNGFEVATELIDEFNKWVFKDVSSRRGRKSAYSKLKDSFEPQMDFGVVKVAEKDFFNIMVKPGRPWEDGHVNTIMYYLRKKAKYSPIPLSYSTVDCWFMTWVDNIEKQWRESNCDMRSISPDHDVGQCIRGFKLLANIPWDNVDNVIIPVNISEKFHWFLVVFRIKLRCLHVYDSMKGGAVHTKKVNEAVGKLATMIPLFLTSTGFYGKRLDLYANKLPKYVHKSQSEPLDIKHMMHAPQQEDISNDCGLYTCLFAEYISNDVFDMRSIDIDAKYHRQRYATILWHYGKTKNEDGAISESEVTGTVASKFGGPRIAKEHVPDTTNYPTPRQRTRN